MEILSLNPEEFHANENSYCELLKDAKNWHRIPLLNHTPLHHLQDISLVRFRGMVQDMGDTEIYLESYEVVGDDDSGKTRMQNGKYRDCLAHGPNERVNLESNRNTYGDRRPIFVISVPGLNDWATGHEQNINGSVVVVPPMKSAAGDDDRLAKNGLGQKRPFDGDSESMESDSVETAAKTTKRICNLQQGQSNSNSLLSAEYLLNSPLPERPSKACLVKLYTNFDSLSLNATIEVVGFLSVDPALDASTTESNEFEEMSEIQAANPPPSLIPRLHAIAVRQMEHVNPLLDEFLLQSQDALESFEVIHKDLQIVLTQCLFGDSIAADFLLSHLISNVFVRTDMQTLGQFSLNICGIPINCLPDYTKDLYDVIQSLLPASHYFPMTIENMNSRQFIPKKEYKTNKLISGMLQLAPQTHLIIDETRLEPGKLETNGVLGVQSLADLIKSQQIKANFEYFEMKYDMNIPVLTLSEGRSMLPCDFQLPLQPDADCLPLINETFKAAKHYLQPRLNAIRKYLTKSKLLKFEINPETTAMIEQDFVDARKEDSNFGPEELNNLLLLARLLATARGKNSLNKDEWNLAKRLQAEQRKRIAALPKRK